MKKPEQINLNFDELESLKSRLNKSNLSDCDKELVQGLVDFNGWLQEQLLEKRVSISRLRTMVFGVPSTPKPKISAVNKANHNSKHTNLDDEDLNDTNELDNPANGITFSMRPGNNGRLSHKRYLNSEYAKIKHKQLSAGSPCPKLCGGKLWNISPGNVLKISGQGFAKATHYEIEKLRCSLCGYLVSANLPEDVSEDKYDYAFKSQLCMLKYYLGLPFYRIEAYQKALGIPLPDASQWDLVEQVANCVYPVFNHLEYLAAQGNLVHLDDTNVKILSSIQANKIRTDKKSRCGTFTTGVISYYQGHQIYLCYSGKRHAGENMTTLLERRSDDLPPIHYMCDALSRNIPKNMQVILINCLAHARRKFVEVEAFFPDHCQYVIEQFATIYRIDAKSKQLRLSPEARLEYHQEHSKPVLIKLKAWMTAQLDDNQIEANNSLGKAMKYMLKHWEALTQFVKTPGAPLDNNILEASLKIPIRIRKNAMFFKTEHGALVGSMLLSLIQTCNAAKVNPVNYLTALQANKKQVFKEPELWFPWNYNSSKISQTSATLPAQKIIC